MTQTQVPAKEPHRPDGFAVSVIGDRINPGFKSCKILLDNEDFAGLQALAVRQAQAGAAYLDVQIGPRALTDPAFAARVVRAIQGAVNLPLCFDSPSAKVQEVCLQSYDQGRAGGRLPMVNSITEQRWDLMELYRLRPFKVIVMVSERVDAGVARPNKTAADIVTTAKRSALRLQGDYAMPADDIYIDVSVSAVAADTEGLNRSALEAIGTIGSDPDLEGIHLTGGLTNIGQQLPPKAADGSDLKLALENAFLTLAVPRGFDTVLGTPWRGYRPLPEDDFVLTTYKAFLGETGVNALRVVRKLYRK